MYSAFSRQNNVGFSLEQLLQIVSHLESAGLLDNFMMSYPEYAIGIEVARAILHRSRNNNLTIPGPQVPATSQYVENAYYTPEIVPAVPSVTGARRFVPAPPPTIGTACSRYGGFQSHANDFAPAQLQYDSPQGVLSQYNPQQGPFSSLPQYGPQQGMIPSSAPHVSRQGLSSIPASILGQPGMLDSTLEQRLAAIPEPCPCPRPKELAGVGGSGTCAAAAFKRTKNSHERDSLDIKCYAPVAGSFSDGIGGHKIKCSQDSADSKAAAAKKAGNLDGVGGRKVKGVEQE